MVTRCTMEDGFAWRGGFGPGARTGHALFFTGEHRFQLVGLETGDTRLVHSEVLDGPMVPLIWRWFDTCVRQGFEVMNQELKAVAENRASAQPWY